MYAYNTVITAAAAPLTAYSPAPL